MSKPERYEIKISISVIKNYDNIISKGHEEALVCTLAEAGDLVAKLSGDAREDVLDRINAAVKKELEEGDDARPVAAI